MDNKTCDEIIFFYEMDGKRKKTDIGRRQILTDRQ